MSNSWFQFKQFRIEQHGASMKVGTDGVLLGAWTNVNDVKRILDIGTGTGLIALMLAQRNQQAHVDAVEIDKKAALQADYNFQHSPWNNRLLIHNSSIQSFSKRAVRDYDLIVCNPPFFVDSLKANEHTRNTARHNDQLSFSNLVDSVEYLLSDIGRFSVILPPQEGEMLKQLLFAKVFFLSRQLNVIPVPGKPVKRLLMEFVKYPTECEEDDLIIETGGRHHYSEEYQDLTRDFYLFL